MDETSYCNISLIIELSQILNNGKNMVEKLNKYPGITEKSFCGNMNELIEYVTSKKMD